MVSKLKGKIESDTKANNKTRRNFFAFFLSEVICLFEEVIGKRQMRLSELDQVPDDILYTMIPVFNKQCPYCIEGDRLLIKFKKNSLFVEIYRMNPREIYILNCFDGVRTLKNIGRLVADKYGKDNLAAFQEVKSFFLFLAKNMICYPAHAHD